MPKPTTSPPDPDRVRSTLIANFQNDEKAMLHYSHKEHTIAVKGHSRDARTKQVYYINGHPVSETIAIDGRELSPQEISAEHQRALQRAQQAAKQPPIDTGGIQFGRKNFAFAQLANDFKYSNGHQSLWKQRSTWIYTMTPAPNSGSHSFEEQVLQSCTGEIWIDAGDMHVMRISLHTFEPVHYMMGFVGTVHSATLELMLQRNRPAEWLAKSASFDIKATVALLKSISQSKQTEFFDYEPLAPTRTASAQH